MPRVAIVVLSRINRKAKADRLCGPPYEASVHLRPNFSAAPPLGLDLLKLAAHQMQCDLSIVGCATMLEEIDGLPRAQCECAVDKRD